MKRANKLIAIIGFSLGGLAFASLGVAESSDSITDALHELALKAKAQAELRKPRNIFDYNNNDSVRYNRQIKNSLS